MPYNLILSLIINYNPKPIIVLSFMFQDAVLLHCRKLTFDGALAHRQSLRHLLACDCRILLDEIENFLLTFSELHLRHVSVMVSDILSVSSCVNDGLKLGWSRFEYRFQFFLVSFQFLRVCYIQTSLGYTSVCRC